jgi:hypothetical protein
MIRRTANLPTARPDLQRDRCEHRSLTRYVTRPACCRDAAYPAQVVLDLLLHELHALSDAEKGRAFERLCRCYLEVAPEYRSAIKRVWMWADWPGRWGPDAGIDLIAETKSGEIWAIQAKAYSPNYTVKKADVDSFLSESTCAHGSSGRRRGTPTQTDSSAGCRGCRPSHRTVCGAPPQACGRHWIGQCPTRCARWVTPRRT